MSDGFQVIDIIFFAMIAAFLVLRLRSVLGRRDGHEGGHSDNFTSPMPGEQEKNKVVPLAGTKPSNKDEKFDAELDGEDEHLTKGFADIKAVDREFNPRDFISGAKMAFEMILGAYSKSDIKTLKPLLSAEVFNNFAQSIKDREQAGEILEETLVSIKKAQIVEAYAEGSIVNVTVKFISEQISALRNKEGEVIEGNPDYVAEITDFWTFIRDAKHQDPNWLLAATRSLD